MFSYASIHMKLRHNSVRVLQNPIRGRPAHHVNRVGVIAPREDARLWQRSWKHFRVLEPRVRLVFRSPSAQRVAPKTMDGEDTGVGMMVRVWRNGTLSNIS